MGVLLRRAALFVAIVLMWALLTAAIAHSATREIVPMPGFAPGTIIVKTFDDDASHIFASKPA